MPPAVPSRSGSHAAIAAAIELAGPPQRQSLVGHLVERLAAQIRAGEIAPGDRLPTEPELCAMFSVSRTVVREAIAQLKAERLVDSVQGLGLYVTRRAPGEGVLRLRGSSGSAGETAREVLEFRAGLETQAARLAALRRSDVDIAAMRAALERLDAAERRGATGSGDDLAFHLAIARASGNPFIVQTLQFLSESLRDAIEQGRGASVRRRGALEAAQREHAEVLAAIVARDATRAMREMARHLANGERRLLEGAAAARKSSSESSESSEPSGADARPRSAQPVRPQETRR